MRPNYTKAECLATAKKYGRKTDWYNSAIESDRAQFASASYFGWLKECCSHMPKYTRHNFDECHKSALKFNHRIDWQHSRSESKYYQAASNHGWLEKCCAHMVQKNVPECVTFIIYAYEFSDNTAYVGATRTPSRRKLRHTYSGPVKDQAELLGEQPVYRVLASGLNLSEASIAEITWIRNYSKTRRMLNSAPGGGIGGSAKRYTPEQCLEISKQYSTNTAFRKGNQCAYHNAIYHGVIKQCRAHMLPLRCRITKQQCFDSAAKHKDRYSWLKGDYNSYVAAKKRGWLDEIGLPKRKSIVKNSS